MSVELLKLLPKERRGSKPRCHWLTHGGVDQIAARLTSMAAPWASISHQDRWMPQGFLNTAEPQLHLPTPLLSGERQLALGKWWLPANRLKARTPNLDIASTCTIDGRPGILLVEAKAHSVELKKEAAGRSLGREPTEERKESNITIGAAIEQARAGLSAATALPFNISRDSHYQLSNRFAWSWKLAQLGVPVVLVYLGFLRADEMADRGEPFPDHVAWEKLVLDHSAPLFPAEVWNRRWLVNDVPFIPLIISMEQAMDREAGP